jgi:hypothetical protein
VSHVSDACQSAAFVPGRASWFVDGLSRLGLGAYVEVAFREYLTVYSRG